MKALLILSISFLLLSCGTDSSKGTAVAKTSSPSSKDTSLAACKVCLIQNELYELDRQRAVLGVNRSAEERESLRAQLDAQTDSLEKIVKKLTDEFGVDHKNSQMKCSALYPADKIKNESIRDSVFYELYQWNDGEMALINLGFPLIDTTDGQTKYDGKYVIKMRGEIHWMTKEEYEVFMTNYYSVKKKIEDRINKKRKELVTQLTGISDPDEYCMEMTSRSADQSLRKRAAHEKFRPSGIFLDEEIISLIRSVTKFD